MSTVTLAGTLRSPVDGLPATGFIYISATLAFDDTVGNATYLPAPVKVALDILGHFEVEVVPTDDPDITVTGWAYKLVYRDSSGTIIFRRGFQITADANLADLAPAVEDPVFVGYVTSVELAAAQTATLASAAADATTKATNAQNAAVATASADATSKAAAAQAAAIAAAATDATTKANTAQAAAATDATAKVSAHTAATDPHGDRAYTDTVAATKANLVGGKVPTSEIPSIALGTSVAVADQAAMLALTTAQVQPGDLARRGDGAGTFMLMATDPSILGNWQLLPAPEDAIQSVNGQLGPSVVLGKADVGLGSVDNTSDANKPVSTAQQTAIDGRQPLDADLTTIAALDSATAGVVASDGAGWLRKSYAAIKTALGLVKADVGLGSVDNTSDAGKPVSTAQQTALDTKITKGTLFFDVRDYGAVGDGIANDLAAINNAITAAIAAGGGTVALRGTHKLVGGTVTVTGADNVTIDGYRGKLVQTSTLTTAIKIHNSTNCKVRGVTIQGVKTDWLNTSAVYDASGVYITGTSSDTTVERIRVYDMAGGGVLGANGVNNVTVNGCTLIGPGTPPIVTDNNSNFSAGVGLLDNNDGWEVTSNRISEWSQGVVTALCNNTRISGNIIKNIRGQHGLYMEPGYGCVVTGNIIDGTQVLGAKFQVGSITWPDITQCQITANTIVNTGSHCILLTNPTANSAIKLRRIIIGNNTLGSNGSGDGIQTNNVIGATISNNSFYNTHIGMYFKGSSELTVSFNRINTCTDQGILFEDTGQTLLAYNRILNPATANGPSNEFGMEFFGTGTSEVHVVGNRVNDTAGNMRYALYVPSSPGEVANAADQTKIYFRNNEFIGATDYGARLTSGTTIGEWTNNVCSGTTGDTLNYPTALTVRGTPRQFLGLTPPTSGAYKVGDITWNTAPGSPGPRGWVCITAGSPGTWSSFGGNLGEISAADPRYGTPGTRSAFIAALDAAEALGKGTVVRIPTGLTIDLVQGLSLGGYSCQIAGGGGAHDGTSPKGSVIKASAQTGPVLDFTGWVTPDTQRGHITPLSGVYVQGDGVADAGKTHSGVKIGQMWGATFRDVTISDTGGPCLDLTPAVTGFACYLSDFERITLVTPVSAKANDVPYVQMLEPNGNRFRGFGLRSTLGSADVGISGAVIVKDGSGFSSHDNLFDGWWFEALHVPTNGTIFAHQGNNNIFNGFQFFDCLKEASATGTSHFRLTTPVINDMGGNTIQGVIPGKGTNATDIDMGVDLQHSRNRIVGIKGYRQTNVVIATGVDYTTVRLEGGMSGTTASGAAIINNSTALNNYLSDNMTGDGTVTSGNVQPEDNNTVAWSFPQESISAFTALPAAGTATIIRVNVRKKRPVTGIQAYIGVIGVGLTGGYASLHKADGTLIGVTADQSSSGSNWSSGTVLKTMPLVSGPFYLDSGNYYICLWYTGTTSPQFGRAGNLSGSAVNANLTAGSFRYATANTGLTTSPPSPLTTQTSLGTMFWGALY